MPRQQGMSHGGARCIVSGWRPETPLELRKDGILVNAADPGYVDTDINDHNGFLTPAQAAKVVVRLATLPADGPTAGFFGEAGPILW